MKDNQGSRIVICSKHGIPYNAAVRGGCARCIREWERQRKAKEARPGLPASAKALALVLVAAGLYLFFSRGRPAEAPVPEQAAPAVVPADLGGEKSAADLRGLIDELASVIRLGRSETEVQLADAGTPERRRESWEFWSFDWSARIERLAARRPAQADPRMAAVHQEVDRILDALRAIPQAADDGVPNASRVTEHLADAERALQQARLHLARLDR